MKKLILLAILFGLSATTYTSAQTNKVQKEMFKTTYSNSKTLVESSQYAFVGKMVFNNSKREKLNSDSSTVTINKSEVSGKITALNAVNKTFDITGGVENYKVSYDDDKQQISIAFKANKYEVSIVVQPNGNAFLEASSSANDTISWAGRLE